MVIRVMPSTSHHEWITPWSLPYSYSCGLGDRQNAFLESRLDHQRGGCANYALVARLNTT